MTTDRIVIRGELWLTLGTVATCYDVDERWVREAFDRGLLGDGEHVADTVAVLASMLDRVALIRRLELQQGLDMARIAWLLNAL